jgi:hypothetical protein
MRAQMVDRHELDPARPGQRLRRREADEERADEPGALRHADARHVPEAHARVVERGAHDRPDELEVPPRRHLGHDPAVARMEIRL